MAKPAGKKAKKKPSAAGTGCGVLALLCLVGLVRFQFRCRAQRTPPDTKVRLGEEGWEQALRKHLAEHGYAHVPKLLGRDEVLQLRELAETYCYGEVRRALPLSYGGYSVPGFLEVPEFEGAAWLPKDQRVHRLLEGAFNGTGYRFASHNDVGCDFVGVWHKDVLRGDVAKFQECDVWSPDAEGEAHEIYKVMFYLQDHEHDEQALKVIPGSHVLRSTPWSSGYVALHPRMGDAVIFDQRLSHAGNTFYSPFGPGRLFIQVGFGRANRFTDEFERGTLQRQNTLRERMLQSSQQAGWATLLTDAKFMLLGTLMSALPPQLLNRFSDSDVKRHASRSCAGTHAMASDHEGFDAARAAGEL